ncbi:hypothetical protein RZO07_24630 [Pseudomonas protegens]|uniref:hypothetical protein n=1 Tax=Pseudomonas protegens TaxID=380021 RepID=UPI0029372F88|nr:hypothetical protein [Pseudomonas protegens]WOE78450.1 hypothetical protein RZO07_24630 [Pseudomonas protegens]
MNAIDFADGLNERSVSFALFRNALHQNDLSASLGWEMTIEKLSGYLASDKTSAKYAEGLEDIYIDLTTNGNKLVKFYKLLDKHSEVTTFLKDNVLKSKSIYDSRFPLPLQKMELTSAPLDIECVNFYEEPGRTWFIFCSKQFIVEKEKLPDDALKDMVINDYGGFDEVYGVRRRAVQLFDIISIDSLNGTLQFRMDGLDIQRAKDIERRLQYLEGKIIQALEKSFQIEEILDGPINFFPAIKTLYHKTDGRIAEIGHTTVSAGVHNGKMRTKKLDFRDDSYHAGGAAKVSELNPHMLSKCWDSPSKYGYVQLVIPGTVALTSSANPMIDTVHILSCASDPDYDFVTKKLLDSLLP